MTSVVNDHFQIHSELKDLESLAKALNKAKRKEELRELEKERKVLLRNESQ